MHSTNDLSLPALPLLPDIDDLSSYFETAVIEAIRAHVINIRARRNYARHYFTALTSYLGSLIVADLYDDASQVERAEWVRRRRKHRADLDLLASRLPAAVHHQIVAAAALGSYA